MSAQLTTIGFYHIGSTEFGEGLCAVHAVDSEVFHKSQKLSLRIVRYDISTHM